MQPEVPLLLKAASAQGCYGCVFQQQAQQRGLQALPVRATTAVAAIPLHGAPAAVPPRGRSSPGWLGMRLSSVVKMVSEAVRSSGSLAACRAPPHVFWQRMAAAVCLCISFLSAVAGWNDCPAPASAVVLCPNARSMSVCCRPE